MKTTVTIEDERERILNIVREDAHRSMASEIIHAIDFYIENSPEVKASLAKKEAENKKRR
jgi:hypothetical protein